MTRPAAYRAPTWSWASLEGSITFLIWQEVESWRYPPTFVPAARLVTSYVDLVSSASPFGQVKSAYVELTGPLVRVEVMITPHGRKGQTESKVRAANMRSYKVFLDTAGTVPFVPDTHASYQCWMRGTCRRDGFCASVDGLPGCGSNFFCLQLFTWECRSRKIVSSSSNLGPVSFFLVSKRESSGEYSRVGIGRALARKDSEWATLGDGAQEGSRFQCPLFEAAEEARVRII